MNEGGAGAAAVTLTAREVDRVQSFTGPSATTDVTRRQPVDRGIAAFTELACFGCREEL